MIGDQLGGAAAATMHDTLRQFRLFADVLSPEQLHQLGQQCRPCLFRAGSLLMTQGDFGNSMFAIVAGTVSVTFVDPTEHPNEVAILSAGDVVGEMALLTGDRRTATATAVTNVDAVEISKPALERMFASAPYLVEGFAATLTLRKAILDQIAAEHRDTLRHHIVRQIRKVFAGFV